MLIFTNIKLSINNMYVCPYLDTKLQHTTHASLAYILIQYYQYQIHVIPSLKNPLKAAMYVNLH